MTSIVPTTSAHTELVTGADPSDSVLVSRALEHDREAFELLVRRHYATAFAVSLAILGERADAEDVCHDAFVRASRALAGCREPAQFRQWLCAITRNCARNRLTRDFTTRTTVLDENRAHAEPDAVEHLHQGDVRERVMRALSALTPMQREVVLLHDMDGCSHAMIAEITGSTEGASRQHLFRARRVLRGAADLKLLMEDLHER